MTSPIPPDGGPTTIHWGAVWTTGIFLGALVAFLFVLQQWILGGSMLGLTLGLALLVVGQHRDNEGQNGRVYRLAGLALLLIIGVGFFLSFLGRG